MPGKIKVKVLAGRNLPVMDRASDTTDAFVEIKFGNVTHKTDVCRKSLNPHWSSTEWYRFEVDEMELQDEPLQLRLMDHDTYSANDAIGKVVISLAPLLAREANNVKAAAGSSGVLSGWIPVFDTMHGIRGELNVIVKVELFSDFNKYKTSSCGVQFFHCPTIPPGYRATAIHGFVEELVVNDDPEYQWIDKIRTPRASNEARQVAFIKLSNQVQRLVGLKAAELGANAVVGYQQEFDLEGEAGVVARAIGTAVNLIPPPTANQSINIPPCTQQQLKKYLDILATDNESITDLNQYFQTHQDELKKLLNIMNPKTPTLLDEPDNVEDDENNELVRRSSVKSYTGSLSIYQADYVSQKSLRHISDDQTDLNKLLKRTEDSDSDSTGPLQKIKNMKTSFFSKRFGSVRSRKSEKQDDQISIQSNSSDTSRMSLTDLRNEFKKLKRLKKPKFRKAFTNKEDEGVGMASILARSVIHAHTSLACIAETQDSENSPSSTMRRTSESEPTFNMSDDEKAKAHTDTTIEKKIHSECKTKVPEIHTSLKNVSSNAVIVPAQRKFSESCPATPMAERSVHLLALPGETGYFGSLSLSGDSSEVYTSSEEDDESSSQKTDTDKALETTSSVVQSVLNNGVNPELIAHMDRKLSILEGVPPLLKESKSHSVFEQPEPSQTNLELSKSSPCIREQIENSDNKIEHDVIPQATSIKDTSAGAEKFGGLHFKFHNPFTHKKVSKSISAPSSPIENTNFMCRSSKKIKRQFSKISKSNMIKSLSHYSLLTKKRRSPTKTTLSQPGSTSDVPSKAPSHETVLGSPFMSYSDLVSLDKREHDFYKHLIDRSEEYDHSQVKMYIGSEPVSRSSLSGPSLYSRDDQDHKHIKRDKTAIKPTGLVHTAMETILMDKVQSLLVPTSPDINKTKENLFFFDVNKKLEKVEEARYQSSGAETEKHFHTPKKSPRPSIKSEGLIHSAIETILLDKVQSLLTPTSAEGEENKFFPTINHHSHKLTYEELKIDEHCQANIRERSRSKEKKGKHESLVNTAMQTILMDKVQTLIPSTPITVSEELDFDDNKPVRSVTNEGNYHQRDEKYHGGLVNTAMETILMEKVQSLIPSPSENNSSKFDKPYVAYEDGLQKKKCNSLLSTATETMLLEKAQSLMPECEQSISQNKEIPGFIPVMPKKSEKIDDNGSFLYKEIEPCLHDEVKSSIATNFKDGAKSKNEKNKDSLFHTAMETLLIDKVKSLVPKTSELNICQNKKLHEDNDQHIKNSTGLLQSAMETLLIDKAQSLIPSTTRDPEIRSSPKLVRQNSVHSLQDNIEGSQKMSKEIIANVAVSFKVTHSKPVLQHFHPILSDPPLETIPSLAENCLDHVESLDVEGVERTCDCKSECQCQECDSETNSASACDNSHAACRFDRNERDKDYSEKDKGSPRHARHESYGGREHAVHPLQHSSFNSTSTPVGIHRRSSDSDLSITPKDRLSGGSLNASLGNTGSGGGAILKPSMNSNNLEMLEYPFLTMTEYPAGFIIHLGGTVCARSVKLVDAGGESAARAAWWAELRTELRAHARALRCNAVIAYTENTAICDDVCILSASGTAAVINLDCDFSMDLENNAGLNGSKTAIDEADMEFCSIAHVPYSPGNGPYRAELSTCGGCRRARVPAVLLATCVKPSTLPSYAKAVTVTAVAARVRRAPPASEPGARDISDQLPFLEYELHKLLIAKLRMQGANALFSLQTQIAMGERCVMALASGTAVRLAALPPPTPPRIKASETEKDAQEIQRALWDAFSANKTANGYDIADSADQIFVGAVQETEGEEAPALDLCADKDACVLELDEAEDIETAKLLASRRMHMEVFSSSLKAAPMSPPLAFAQVWRSRLMLSGQGGGASMAAERHMARALDGVTYKLRRLQPCAMVAPKFQLELPEDEIQLILSGSAIPLLDPNKPEHNLPETSEVLSASTQHHSNENGFSQGFGTADMDDDIFTLDEEQMTKSQPQSEVGDEKNIVINGQTPTAVSVTSLSYVSGSRTLRRVCALRLLFVRETTAVRELGGLSGFLHTFTCEVLSIARAYTAALGGNALTSFYITQLMLQDNAHKNQGQCLLSVGGDVVHITY